MKNIIFSGHSEILRPLQTKNPDKKMNEYSVPFLLERLKVRISWGLPHDRPEGNDRLFGQYILFAVGVS